MNRCFVDTNLFIRYLTNDDPALADRVEQLLDDAATGAGQLVTTELVVAETVWVLESSYHLNNDRIAPLMRGILATPGLEVINSDLIGKALVMYKLQNIVFVDALYSGIDGKTGDTGYLFLRQETHFAHKEHNPQRTLKPEPASQIFQQFFFS